MTDLRFVIRQLYKSPGFTALAVLSLALAIGMNSAIFSLIHDVFFRGLPFDKPDQIFRIYGEAKERNLERLPFSVPRYWHYRDTQTVFTRIAADTETLRYIITGMGDPIQVKGANVTANYFDVLGIQPLRGRLFLQDEETTADVALVSKSFWTNRLESDPNVVGRSITVNGVSTIIVGVLPEMPSAWFGRAAEIWIAKPFELPGLSRERMMRGASFLRVIGRIKQGVTVDQVRVALPAIQESYRALNQEKADSSWSPLLVPITEDITGDLRRPFLTLFAAVGCVLLIACSNVANLLLVRFTARRREIALRMALGGSRGKILRLFLLESTLVSLIAGALGICIAGIIVLYVSKIAIHLPIGLTVRLNWLVLGFALAIAIITGLAMGAYPAWQSSRRDLVNALKDGGRSVSGGRGQQRFRRALVIVQVALSIVLLSGAGLLISSFLRLREEQLGFRAEGIWVGSIGLPQQSYADPAARARFANRLQTELAGASEIEAAGISDVVPLSGPFSRAPYAVVGEDSPPVSHRPLGLSHSISPGYLHTFRIALLAGRDFNDQEGLESPLVVLISRSTAQKLFFGRNPLGSQLWLGSENGTGLRVEVVGVVGDVRSVQLSRVPDVVFYRPWAQRPQSSLMVSARGRTHTRGLENAVRAALNKINSQLPIAQPDTMQGIVAASVGQQRLVVVLLATFAAAAFLFSLVGIYGAVGYTVEQRTGEIGVRVALGAQKMDILRLIMRQGLIPVFIGLAAGLAATLALGRVISAQLYQVAPGNPVILGGISIIFAMVAFVACFVPARRACELDPLETLRAE